MKSTTPEEPKPNFIVRYFTLLYDTLQYIRLHGWAEYRKARERYDRHQEALKNKEARYTKKGEIERSRQIMRQRNR